MELANRNGLFLSKLNTETGVSSLKAIQSRYKLKRRTKHEDSKKSDKKKTGGLYNVKDNFKAPVKDNEWFDYDILVKGKHIVVKINGETIEYLSYTKNIVKKYF